METLEIINRLYRQYYLENNTPEQYVSSHWEYYQSQVKVRIEAGNIKSLAGAAFGDLEQRSIISRIFSWLTIGSYLLKLPHRKEICHLIKPAIRLTQRMGLAFTYDCFRQICSLALIKRYEREREKINTIIIGDGYGFLASLIKEIYPDSQVLLVDLGKILLFQAYYCGKAHPDATHYLVTPSAKVDQSELKLNYDFIYCPAEHLELVSTLSFDLAVNIASMQEMNKGTIKLYFNYLRQHLILNNLFYCCNREEKIMPGGEISQFFRYPWSDKDVHLVDEYCPWHKYFLSRGRAKNGPALLGFRIPLINYFDGPHRHKLTVLDVNRKKK